MILGSLGFSSIFSLSLRICTTTVLFPSKYSSFHTPLKICSALNTLSIFLASNKSISNSVGVKSNAPKEINDSEIKEQSLDLNKQMQQSTATPNFGETAPAQDQQAAPAQETPKQAPAATPEKK